MTAPTHAEFQAQIVDLAHACGWRHLHVRRSIGKGRQWVTATNVTGWPDLTLWRPPDRLIFAELKIPPDKLRPEQAEVLDDLALLDFADVHVWTPADWPTIQAALARRPRANLRSGIPPSPLQEHPSP